MAVGNKRWGGWASQPPPNSVGVTTWSPARALLTRKASSVSPGVAAAGFVAYPSRRGHHQRVRDRPRVLNEPVARGGGWSQRGSDIRGKILRTHPFREMMAPWHLPTAIKEESCGARRVGWHQNNRRGTYWWSHGRIIARIVEAPKRWWSGPKDLRPSHARGLRSC